MMGTQRLTGPAISEVNTHSAGAGTRAHTYPRTYHRVLRVRHVAQAPHRLMRFVFSAAAACWVGRLTPPPAAAAGPPFPSRGGGGEAGAIRPMIFPPAASCL
jgi:hypothetical protein